MLLSLNYHHRSKNKTLTLEAETLQGLNPQNYHNLIMFISIMKKPPTLILSGTWVYRKYRFCMHEPPRD